MGFTLHMIHWSTLRTLFLTGVLMFFFDQARTQQVGRYSMYMQNFYAINPAAAGLEDHLDATLGYRQQWLGFENSPQNYFVSANMPLAKEMRSPAPNSLRISSPDAYDKLLPTSRQSKSAIGGMVNVNSYGAFRYTQAYATYAFHLPVTRKLNLSFGSNVGVNSFTIDRSLISLEMPQDAFFDQILVDAQQNSTLLDIDVGFMLYSKRMFLGYSSEQLLGNRIGFGGKAQFGDLVTHHRVLIGRSFRLDRNWRFIPNGFVYFTTTNLLSVEANIRVDYRDQIWGGISYRHQDAIIPMIGMYVNNQIKLGYAYDFNISGLRQYIPAGSHELMLGFMFGNKRVVF
jgi:type IX secretion system PorP/SprF family membrane protein